MCSVVERLVVSVDVEKDGGRTLPLGVFTVFTNLCAVASRYSVYSIYYTHCSVPHRTSYWTACSGLLYIVSCFELCCRVSVLGLYDTLCRKQQICRRNLHRWSCLSGNRLQCVGSDLTVGWCMTSCSWSRIAPWLGVVQLLGIFCLE